MPESHASHYKRVQRALLTIVEDESVPVAERLVASAQLLQLKGLKPVRKQRLKRVKDSSSLPDNVLGTRG